ncbi:MAG: Protein-serine/threonine phosphatase [Bacteroidota bacterium]
MGRTLVIGDIHSGKRGLEQALDRARIQPGDHLIFLGDYVDAWSEAAETVNFLITLQSNQQCTFLRGNHDDLCLNYLTKAEAPVNWLLHGGQQTKDSYDGQPKSLVDQHIAFLDSLEDYYLDTSNNRLFLHAGYTNLRGVTHEYFSKTFYWDRTLWELAQVVESSGSLPLPPRLMNYKELFIGHTPVSKTELVTPRRAANVWNIDTGAAFKGAVSILDVDTKQFWQSDRVELLYPGEPGRNLAP